MQSRQMQHKPIINLATLISKELEHYHLKTSVSQFDKFSLLPFPEENTQVEYTEGDKYYIFEVADGDFEVKNDIGNTLIISDLNTIFKFFV